MSLPIQRWLAKVFDCGVRPPESKMGNDDALEFASEYVARPGHILDAPGREIIRMTIFRLPPEAREWLAMRKSPVIFHCRDDGPAFTYRHRDGLPRDTEIVLLKPTVSQMERAQATGIIAHELGHVYHRDAGDEKTGRLERETQADERAATWGFRASLIASHEVALKAAGDPSLREELRQRIDALRALSLPEQV